MEPPSDMGPARPDMGEGRSKSLCMVEPSAPGDTGGASPRIDRGVANGTKIETKQIQQNILLDNYIHRFQTETFVLEINHDAYLLDLDCDLGGA